MRDVKNGLNYALRVGAERVREYPVIQARIRHSNGGEGYMTVTAANTQMYDASLLLSDFSGTVVSLKSQAEVGRRPQTGFTPVARSVLAQMKGEKRVESGSSPAVLASAVPALR
jgi:hypothetical protein